MNTPQVKGKRRSPEKKVQRGIVKDLWMLGFHVSSLSQPRRTMQTRGLPDLFAAHPKYGAIWIEVKAGKNDLSPDQRQWHSNARECGVRVCVARCTKDVLDALGIETK